MGVVWDSLKTMIIFDFKQVHRHINYTAV